ncbi:MAG: hypothetical protein CVU56_07150 [Deltaproteobacteria bacterium HGW-Deltaproteobacteria-14]|nr:MAG: hypothetical protein CVU56_07150 [Deltaproteobacteria bacterium HGW-Deltaproteobacteria-14]
MEVRVAPLNLAGVTNARYRVTVVNGLTEQVAQVDLDADRYGDGAGSLAYVVPCDAGANDNQVTVEILDLYGGDPQVALTDFQNPGPLTKTVTCRENADVAVSFDIVVARQANQGFFDIAVELSDVFCSAKLDCVDDGPPVANIDLLFKPGGGRDTTVVLALACTGGVGSAQATHLYLDDIGLDCDADELADVVLDPTAGPGNAYGAASPDPDPADAVFQYAVFAGQEALTVGGDPAGKRYWNVAIGLDTTRLGAGCRLKTRATASDGALAGNAPPADTTYPVIAYDVLLSADGGGLMQCGHNPVNGAGSGVTTAYLAASPTPEPFDAAFAAATGLARTLRNLPASCTEVLERDPGATSGLFTVDPDGDAGAFAPLEVYCDMDLLSGEALTLVLKRPANVEGTAAAGSGVPSDSYYKLPTTTIDFLQGGSDAWIIYGPQSGEVVQFPTTGTLPNGPANSYDGLASAASGSGGMGGCGADIWGTNGFEVLTGLPGGATCYAYPTTANFYDFLSSSGNHANTAAAFVYLRGNAGLGLSQGSAAASCLAIRTADAAATSGSYWIDPNGGATSDAFEVWCDMSFDSGGWTLVVKHTSDGLPFTTAAQNLGDMAVAPVTSDAKVSDAAINALTWTEWRIEVDGDPARQILSQSGQQFNVAWTTNYNAWTSGSADNGRNQTWCYDQVPAYGTQCYAIGNTNTYAVSPHEASNGGTWVHTPHATAGASAIGGFSCGFGTSAEANCTVFNGLDIRHWVR